MAAVDAVSVEIPHIEELNPREVRRVYLITYSQADMDIVPSCETFSRIVLEAFENVTPETKCLVV